MQVKSDSEVAQLYPTLSDPMDCSPPGSSVHGICQERILEWVAIVFSHYRLVLSFLSQPFHKHGILQNIPELLVRLLMNVWVVSSFGLSQIYYEHYWHVFL